jgi:predicted unusual protein kinase regulating ubiquinone biosynthesis (AarF/ABC1/UbiB family)
VAVFQPEPGGDVAAVKRELREVLAQYGTSGPLRDHRVTEQLVRGMRVGARHRLRAQSDLFMVLRNLTIVEEVRRITVRSCAATCSAGGCATTSPSSCPRSR